MLFVCRVYFCRKSTKLDLHSRPAYVPVTNCSWYKYIFIIIMMIMIILYFLTLARP